MWRTTDLGETWKSIGGPSNGPDTRFFVLESCDGGTVIAADRDGSIWLTTDGGDGLLPERHRKGEGTLNVQNLQPISACSWEEILATIVSNDCLNGLTVTKLELLGDTSHFQLVDIPPLPTSFGGGTSDTFRLRFDPQLAAGDYSITLHLHGRVRQQDGAFDVPVEYDTMVTLRVSALAAGPRVTSSLPTQVDFGTLSLCEPGRDTVITITNKGCAPDTLTRFDLVGAGFMIDPQALPIIIAQDSSYRFVVHYLPTSASVHSATLDVSMRSQSSTGTVGYSFSGTATSGSASLSIAQPTVDLGTFTVCSGDTTVVLEIVSGGCDSLHVLGATLTGDAGYTLSGSRDTTVASGSPLRYHISFHPSPKGSATAVVHVRASGVSGGPPIDTMIIVSAGVLDGTRFLTTSTPSLDFGELGICNVFDTSLVFENAGCDTLEITDATLIGSSGFTITGGLPVRLVPGETVRLALHLTPDTAGHPLTAVTTIRITSTSTIPVPNITVSGRLRYSSRFALALKDGLNVPNLSGTANDAVTIELRADQALPASITSLDVTIITNDDLLSFRDVLEPGVQVTSTTRRSDGLTERTLRIVPAGTSLLATLRFRVELAKDSMSPISIEQVRINGLELSEAGCIAVLDSRQGGSFSYMYHCGEGLISTYLRSGQVVAFGAPAYPNPVTPASAPAFLPFHTATSGTARLHVYDASGEERYSVSQWIANPGSHSFVLPITQLSSGSYHYTIDFPAGMPVIREEITIRK